jgi:hypothetical protein
VRKQKEEAEGGGGERERSAAHVTSGSCLPMCDHMGQT